MEYLDRFVKTFFQALLIGLNTTKQIVNIKIDHIHQNE